MGITCREAKPEHNTHSAWIKSENQANAPNGARTRNWIGFAGRFDHVSVQACFNYLKPFLQHISDLIAVRLPNLFHQRKYVVDDSIELISKLRKAISSVPA